MEKVINEFPLVFIVILNWNSHEDTAGCVNSCRGLGYPNFRIVLVDNGSTDGSQLKLRESFPDVKLLQTGTNLGYAAGNNMGISHALKNGAEFIWIMNPDVRVENGSLGMLVDVMIKYPSAGICGPRIVQGSPEERICFDGLSIIPDKGYLPRFNVVENWFTEASSEPLDVDCVSGCSMLIRGKLFRDIGLFREDFFLYYEDTELNFRARKYGWRTAICRQAIVTHRKDHRDRIEKNGISLYTHLCKSGVIFSRIQKKHILKTAASSIGHSRFKCLFNSFKAVISGLRVPIKPVPVFCDQNAKNAKKEVALTLLKQSVSKNGVLEFNVKQIIANYL